MIPASLSPIANHLWQSTLFAGAAGLLTLALRKNSARVRHWIWVAASLKFLVPLSLLITIGSYVQRRTALVASQSTFSVVLDHVSQPFAASADSVPAMSAAPARTSATSGDSLDNVGVRVLRVRVFVVESPAPN